MVDDHMVVSRVGDDPAALARGIARHPVMYMGGPATYERAVAYVHGVEMAMLAAGAESPLGDDDKALLLERPESGRSQEQGLVDIRRLEPQLAKLFAALPKEIA